MEYAVWADEAIERRVNLVHQQKAALRMHPLRYSTHRFVRCAHAAGIVKVGYRNDACLAAQRVEYPLGIKDKTAGHVPIEAPYHSARRLRCRN